MDRKNFKDKKNIKTYSIYKNSKIKSKKSFRFFKMVLLFLVIAAISYLSSMFVYSFINRKHCESVVIDESYKEDVKNNSNNKQQIREHSPKILNEYIKAVEAPKKLMFNGNVFRNFLKGVKRNNHNAVVVTLKDEAGNILYDTDVSLANKWKVVSKEGVVDLKKVFEIIEEEGLIPIAKINVFKDQRAPSPERENTFVFEDYEDAIYKFKDKETGNYLKYLDPESENTKKYIFDIIKEIKSCGFSYILLQNVSYPDCEFSKNMKGSDSIKRSVVLKRFFRELKKLKAHFIVGYDWDVLKNPKEDLRFLCDVKDLGIDINMPIVYRYENFEEFNEEILKLSKSKKGIVVIPKIEFKRNLNKVLGKLKEEKIESYVILQSS